MVTPRTVAPPTVVTEASLQPAMHSLLVSARSTNPEQRWEGGLAWYPEYAGLGWGTWDQLPVDDEGVALTGVDAYMEKSDEGAGSSEVIYQPFVIELASSCSAAVADAVGVEARAKRQLEGITPLALEEEFWDGNLRPTNLALRRSTPGQSSFTLTDPTTDPIGHDRLRPGILNPSFVDHATLTAVSATNALRLLTLGLSRSEMPSKGMIHAPAHLVEAWAANGHLEKDGVRIVTKSRGDVVVAYSGGSWSGPRALGSAGNADVDTHWAYATSMVEIRLGDPKPYEETVSEALRRRLGRIGYRIERTAAVTCDPNCMYAVKVDTLT